MHTEILNSSQWTKIRLERVRIYEKIGYILTGLSKPCLIKIIYIRGSLKKNGLYCKSR